METIYTMMYDAMENLHKARDMQDPKLTKAVLINLYSVLPSYIDALENVKI